MALATRYGFADVPQANIGDPSQPWTNLAAQLNSGVTSLSVDSAADFPSLLEFDIIVGVRETDGTLTNAERMHVTGVFGTTFTVQRTQAIVHALDEEVYHELTALGLQNSPGAMTDTGDLQYLAATGRTARLAAGGDGTYVRYASGIPTVSAIVAGDLPNHSAALLTSGMVPLARLSGLTTTQFASAAVGQWTNDAAYTTLAAVAGVGYLTSVTPHALLSTTHSDIVAASVVKGDLLIGDATPKWARFPAPSDGIYGLSWTSGVPGWSAIVSGGITGTIAAGQVAYGSGADAIVGDAAFTYDPTTALFEVPAAHFPGVATNVPFFRVGSDSYSCVEGDGCPVIQFDHTMTGNVLASGAELMEWGLNFSPNADLADAELIHEALQFQGTHNYTGTATGRFSVVHAATSGTMATMVNQQFQSNSGGPVVPVSYDLLVRAPVLFSGGTMTLKEGIHINDQRVAGVTTARAFNYADLFIVAGDGKLTVPAAGLTIGASIVTLSGNFTTTGAFNPTFAIPSSSTWTLPTSGGTLANLDSVQAFTNKTGNISQWTNDTGYLTSVTAHNLLSATHGDTTAGAVARGDLITGQGATPKWVRLAKGTANQVLAMDGTATDIAWTTIAGGGDALVANPLSQFAATTSLQLKGVISDETGSGALVFADTPTLLTPAVASFANATHTHLNAAGGGTLTIAALSNLGADVGTWLATPSSVNLNVTLTGGKVPIVIASSGVASSTTNSATEVNLAVVTVPAGVMGTNGHLVIESLWKFVGTAGTKTTSIRHNTTSGAVTGGTLIKQITTSSTSLSARFLDSIWNTNAAAAQALMFRDVVTLTANNNALATGAIDTASASYLNFNALTANSGDTAQLVGYTVTLYPGV